MDQHTRERRFARCSHLWDAARDFRRHATPELDKATRRDRIKANTVTTAASVIYHGGTIGAGIGFYTLLDNHSPIAIAVLVVFVLIVEGLLRTLLDELLDVDTSHSSDTVTAAATTKTEEAH